MLCRTRFPVLRRSRFVLSSRRGRRAVVALVALLVTLSSQASGRASEQQAQPTSQDQPSFRTEANFILTDVFVTRDGRPVADLTINDFEVKEDGALQTIKSFEYVRITPGVSVGRREPSTVGESNAAASDPRRRVFVLFLDTFHVTRFSSMAARQGLLDFATKVLGPDDLIALVTPQMGGSDLAFSTRPDTIRSFFANNPVWGVADETPGTETDPVEKDLSTCSDWAGLRMRLREQRTFQAMRDMVRYLDGMRESRKAIVVVSEGWSLFKRNERVLNDSGRAPGMPVIGVGPDGRLGDLSRNRTGSISQYDCDTMRLELMNLDTSEQFRTAIIGEANRANAAYYTIDAAGLRTGAPLSATSTDPLAAMAQARNPDREAFSTPLRTLQTLGPATNGLAITDTNDLAAGLQRIADEFSSFYLLGYNSTNSRLDGRYRRISVKVKRPGVEVRARDGYTAGSPATMTRTPPTKSPAAPPVSDAEAMVTAALSRIATIRSGAPFILYAAFGMAANGHVVRVVAELDSALAPTPDWRDGGQAQVIIRNSAGATVGSSTGRFAPGDRVVRLDVPVSAIESGGDLHVQMRLSGTGSLARLTDATSIRVESPPRWGAPLVLRRGPSTGIAYVPTADLRFRRQERLRIELASPGAEVTAALVDRTGKPLGVPVQLQSATPEHALTADVSLAPLAEGDYAVVLTRGDTRLVVPVRVIP
jgi:VWFA-related protein